jgi:hypothetical protein
VGCAGGDDQIVVRDLIAIDRHALCRRIDRLDVGEQHLDISLTAQHPADRRGNVAWRQRRGRHLVEKRLKEMIVVAIEDRDADRRTRQRARGLEPAESTADDHDVRRVLRHGEMLSYGAWRNPFLVARHRW